MGPDGPLCGGGGPARGNSVTAQPCRDCAAVDSGAGGGQLSSVVPSSAVAPAQPQLGGHTQLGSAPTAVDHSGQLSSAPAAVTAGLPQLQSAGSVDVGNIGDVHMPGPGGGPLCGSNGPLRGYYATSRACTACATFERTAHVAHLFAPSSPSALHVVVSMTSIPARNGTLGPTIASLRAQTRPPNEIRLYLGPGCGGLLSG